MVFEAGASWKKNKIKCTFALTPSYGDVLLPALTFRVGYREYEV